MKKILPALISLFIYSNFLSANEAVVYRLNIKHFKCVLKNLEIYSNIKGDLVPIVLEICPEAPKRPLLYIMQNEVPNINIIADEQYDRIIFVTRRDFECLRREHQLGEGDTLLFIPSLCKIESEALNND